MFFFNGTPFPIVFKCQFCGKEQPKIGDMVIVCDCEKSRKALERKHIKREPESWREIREKRKRPLRGKNESG